ncbi:hypothetical protein JR316_0005961 [Psilocybe cubensis]|uniref:Uncharacterized protein n=2 Tax=Psilocybe cubensis TaxID=181762 RepID=A0ACB8H0B1_PSICU|nr:hypothetical protein JR316_0005961 [Psilocybe cubensis]KAH9481435.1 hypothetical protein JR316_0005961 [Psilocybe cubensis]
MFTFSARLWAAAGCAVISYLAYSTQTYFTTQLPKAAFRASRLTPSTFLITEYNDIFSEHPFIYAKVVPSANTILIIDTGCGGLSNDTDIEITSLRKFIESANVKDNNGAPINEGGKMGYVVALTHVHYDHILAVEDFKDWPILASAHSPSFLEKDAIPEHSICNALNLTTPQYTPTLVPHMHNILSSDADKKPLGMTILHTPGHTPDEIALYDEVEKMLYVGDSLYEWEPIIFPKEGSIATWFSSMDYLISFVEEKNSVLQGSDDKGQAPSEILINSGHCTARQPALDVLIKAKYFMEDVVAGKEEVKERGWSRGEATVMYGKTGDRFSLRCPERLVHEAQNVMRND